MAVLNVSVIFIQSDSNLANEVFNICNGALHFEALRTNTPEAVAADSAFLTLTARCQESCQLIENCTSSVTEVEENIMTSRVRQFPSTLCPCPIRLYLIL